MSMVLKTIFKPPPNRPNLKVVFTSPFFYHHAVFTFSPIFVIIAFSAIPIAARIFPVIIVIIHFSPPSSPVLIPIKIEAFTPPGDEIL